jgi:hypothetical protein
MNSLASFVEFQESIRSQADVSPFVLQLYLLQDCEGWVKRPFGRAPFADPVAPVKERSPGNSVLLRI